MSSKQDRGRRALEAAAPERFVAMSPASMQTQEATSQTQSVHKVDLKNHPRRKSAISRPARNAAWTVRGKTAGATGASGSGAVARGSLVLASNLGRYDAVVFPTTASFLTLIVGARSRKQRQTAMLFLLLRLFLVSGVSAMQRATMD